MQENFRTFYISVSALVALGVFVKVLLHELRLRRKSLEFESSHQKRAHPPYYSAFQRRLCLTLVKCASLSVSIGLAIFVLGGILELLFLENRNVFVSLVLFPLIIPWIAYSLIHLRDCLNPTNQGGKIGEDERKQAYEKVLMLFLNVLFPQVDREIKILAGGLCPHFYGNAEIISALAYLKQKGKKISILALEPGKIPGEGGTPEHVTEVEEKVIRRFRQTGLDETLHFLPTRPKGCQFVVIDDKIVRIEDSHDPWWSQELKTFRATIYSDPGLARHYERQFDELLHQASNGQET